MPAEINSSVICASAPPVMRTFTGISGPIPAKTSEPVTAPSGIFTTNFAFSSSASSTARTRRDLNKLTEAAFSDIEPIFPSFEPTLIRAEHSSGFSDINFSMLSPTVRTARLLARVMAILRTAGRSRASTTSTRQTARVKAHRALNAPRGRVRILNRRIRRIKTPPQQFMRGRPNLLLFYFEALTTDTPVSIDSGPVELPLRAASACAMPR